MSQNDERIAVPYFGDLHPEWPTFEEFVEEVMTRDFSPKAQEARFQAIRDSRKEPE